MLWSGLPRPALCSVGHGLTQLPGPPFWSRVLYVLCSPGCRLRAGVSVPAECVCCPTPSCVGPPSLCCWFLQASLSSLSPPSGWGHSLRAVHRLRNADFSVFCLLSLYFPQFSRLHIFCWPGRELPCAWELLLFHNSLCPLGHSLLSRSSFPFSLLLLFYYFYPLSCFISGSLACPPGGLESSAVSSRLLCRSFSIS